jgi:hypothetical protein
VKRKNKEDIMNGLEKKQRQRIAAFFLIAATLLLPIHESLATVYRSNNSGVVVGKRTSSLNNNRRKHYIRLRVGRAVTYQGYQIRLVRINGPQYRTSSTSRGQSRDTSGYFVIRSSRRNWNVTLRRWQAYRLDRIWIEPTDFTSSGVRLAIWQV